MEKSLGKSLLGGSEPHVYAMENFIRLSRRRLMCCKSWSCHLERNKTRPKHQKKLCVKNRKRKFKCLIKREEKAQKSNRKEKVRKEKVQKEKVRKKKEKEIGKETSSEISPRFNFRVL